MTGIRSLFGAGKRQPSPLAVQPEVPSTTIGNPAWANFMPLQPTAENQYVSDSDNVDKSHQGPVIIDRAVAEAMSAAIASAVLGQIQAQLVSVVAQSVELTFSRHEDRLAERVGNSLVAVLEKAILPRLSERLSEVEAVCNSHEVQRHLSAGSLGSRPMMMKAAQDAPEMPSPTARKPMWTAVKHFVRGAGEEGAKAPPSLDSLQDAADADLFSEHRIGQRSHEAGGGLFATPKVMGNRRMILGAQSPAVQLNVPGAMRHTLGTPLDYMREANHRVQPGAGSSSAYMPDSQRMSSVVPSQQDAAPPGIGDVFSYYKSNVSGTPTTREPTPGATQEGSLATGASDTQMSTMASSFHQEQMSPSLPPPTNPRPPSASCRVVLTVRTDTPDVREGRSASPANQGRPRRDASAHSSPDAERKQRPWHLDSLGSTSTAAPERRRASETSIPPRLLKRQDSDGSASIEAMPQNATVPNLPAAAMDEPGSPCSRGSRRSSLTPPPAASRAMQRRHTSHNEMAHFTEELVARQAQLVRETSGESVLRSVSLTMGAARSRTPPPNVHHSQRSEQPIPSPPRTALSEVCAQALTRQPCREPPQPDREEGIMERFKRRFSGPIDEVAALRHARETDLLKEIEQFDEPRSLPSGCDPNEDYPTSDCSTGASSILHTHAGRHVAAPWQLRIWGVLPWKNGPHQAPKFPNISWSAFKNWLFDPETYTCAIPSLYQRLVLTISIATVFFGVENLMAAQRGRLREAELGAPLVLSFQEVTDLTIAVGSLLGLILMRRGLVRHNLLGSYKAMLVGYAKREQLIDAWCHVTERENPVWVLVWLLSIVARAMAPVQQLNVKDIVPMRWALSVASFGFCSGLFLALTQTVQHVVILLPMMVDAFCFHFVHRPYLDDNVRDWGLLQAALRRASNAVERCFLVLETITLVMVLISITAMALTPLDPLLHLWLLVAVLLVTAVEVRLFFKAAQVTEKCQRVPSLINSMCFGQNVDVDRHYLVEYITFSAAGFYVFQVRLTAAMALKLAYVSVLLAFAVATNIASKW